MHIIDYDMVCSNTMSELKKAQFFFSSLNFAVLKDEVSCHNAEIFPFAFVLLMTMVSFKKSLYHLFKSYPCCKYIMLSLGEFRLSQSDLRGQGYDGASVMNGEKISVPALFCERQFKALYTYCAGHFLNLVILNSVLF